MRLLGNFAEFTPNATGAVSLRSVLDTQMPDRLRRLVAFYLLQAGVLRYTMERLPDVLDGEEVFLSGGLKTDGSWYWRADLSHYVMKYGIPLPEEFLQNAERNHWSPPVLTEEERGRLARQLRRDGDAVG